MEILLIPDIIQVATNAKLLLIRNVRKMYQKLLNWKCSDNKMVWYAQNCYNVVTRNERMKAPSHPRKELKEMMNIWIY